MRWTEGINLIRQLEPVRIRITGTPSFRGGSGRLLGQALLGLMLGGSIGRSASADESRFYVLRHGTKIPVSQSPTEFGVVFREDADIEQSARRLAAQGKGVVEKVPGIRNSRLRVLRTSETSAKQRNVVLHDPDVADARPVYRFQNVAAPMVSSGQIVAKTRGGLTDAELDDLWNDYQVDVIQASEDLPDVYLLKTSADDHDEVLRAELLAGDRRVRWAQPNFRRPPKLRQMTAEDAFFPLQWHLNNTGQTGGTSDADIDAPEAWVLSEGQDVLIGMFDDACDVEHEDLRENYIGIGHDPTLESDQPGFTDPRVKQLNDEHGTAVMGLAVARANSVGVRGVAYLSRFTVSRGVDSLLTDFDRASAFTFARQQDVDVHIDSWGVDGPNSAVVEEAIEIAFEQGRPVEDGDQTLNLGMVIVWASGNDSNENFSGFDYSTLPQVIGVGASTHRDERAFYSNFGVNIDMLAPGGDSLADRLTTTDNTDRAAAVDNGFNVNGAQDDGTLFDDDGRYTNTFSGTSAACPIAAGVAALVISMNPRLSAADVRLILEHTCDQVNDDEADYHPITGRSTHYGFGRINAHRAVQAARQSVDNGGFTWPGRVFNVRVRDGQLRWQTSVGTDEFLVVESDAPFEFRARDGQCYDRDQAGCGGVAPEPLPSGVRPAAVIFCNAENCDLGDEHAIAVDTFAGTKYFGIFGRSLIGRYSFGVAADSDGNVTDAGPAWAAVGDDAPDPDGGSMDEGPKVTISVSPLEGTSPLRVRFRGNAVSSLPIDDSRTEWDFDVDSTLDIKATTRDAEYVYVVERGTRTFTARLTMYDTVGNVGSASVMIRVRASEGTGGTDDDPGGSEVRILIGVPGNPTADVDSGRSPFEVQLSIDASSLAGTYQSIVWDLGDGSLLQRSLVVTHTYVNTTGTDMILPITVTVTTRSTGGAVLQTSATRLITIRPNPSQPPASNENTNENDNGGGGGTDEGCGPFGFLPFLGSLGFLLLLRRRA